MVAATPTPDQLIALVVGMYATKWLVEEKSPPVLTTGFLDEALQNLASKHQVSAELVARSRALLAQPSSQALVGNCTAVAAYALGAHVQAPPLEQYPIRRTRLIGRFAFLIKTLERFRPPTRTKTALAVGKGVEDIHDPPLEPDELFYAIQDALIGGAMSMPAVGKTFFDAQLDGLTETYGSMPLEAPLDAADFMELGASADTPDPEPFDAGAKDGTSLPRGTQIGPADPGETVATSAVTKAAAR